MICNNSLMKCRACKNINSFLHVSFYFGIIAFFSLYSYNIRLYESTWATAVTKSKEFNERR